MQYSLISPFNFPLNLTAHKIAPAIAAGCPFVLKPPSLTPISALKIAEILAETDSTARCLFGIALSARAGPMYWSLMTVLNYSVLPVPMPWVGI